MSGLKTSASFTLASSLISGGLQVLQLSIAAHELSTAEYALLALVNVTLGIIAVLQDAGLINFGVQLQEFGKRINSTLFWISCAFGISAALIMLLASPLLESFYRLPGLSAALSVAALNLVILGFTATYQSIFIKKFKAKALAIAEIAARPIAFACFWLMLHEAGLGVYAVIWSTIIFGVAKLIFLILMAQKDWHPGLQFDKSIAVAALRFGSYQFGAQVINQLRTQADQIILGRVLSADNLGVYALAKDLALLPLKFVQPLFSRLALPLYSKAKNVEAELNRAAMKGLRLTSILSCLIYGGLALTAPIVVNIMYGKNHGPLHEIVAMLCLFAALRPIGLNTAMLAQSKGRTDIEFKWNVAAGVVAVGLFLVLAPLVSTPLEFACLAAGVQVAVTLLSYRFFVKPVVNIGFAGFVSSWGLSFALLGMAVAAAYFYVQPLLISRFL